MPSRRTLRHYASKVRVDILAAALLCRLSTNLLFGACSSPPVLNLKPDGRYAPAYRLTWSPPCEIDAIQFYDATGNLLADIKNAVSGGLSLADLVKTYTGPGAVKLWFNSGLDTLVSIVVDPCVDMSFNLSKNQIVTLDTPISLLPASCSAVAIQSYRAGKLLLNLDRPRLGLKIGDLIPSSLWPCGGTFSLSVFTGGATASSIVPVVLPVPADWSFKEGFEQDYVAGGCYAEPQLTPEDVRPGCSVNTGATATIDGAKGAATGLRALTTTAAPGKGQIVHLDRHQEILSSPLPDGDWMYSVSAKPADDTKWVETSFALYQPVVGADGTQKWANKEFALQKAEGCRWAIWTTESGSTAARWLLLDEPYCLDAEAFYRITLSFHQETDPAKSHYVSLTINGTQSWDLQKLHVPLVPKTGWAEQYSGVYSLEVENANVCGTSSSSRASTVWDDVLLTKTVPANTMASVPAAGLGVGRPMAPGAFVSSFLSKPLAVQVASASTVPLPTLLVGIRLNGTDGKGRKFDAPLFFVSPTQINWLLPPDVEQGTVLLEVIQSGVVVASGFVSVAEYAPGIFSAGYTADAPPAGFFTIVMRDGSVRNLLAAELSGNTWVPSEVSVSDPNVAKAVLTIYATGLHGATTGSATVEISGPAGTAEAPLLYVGSSGFIGVEQINVELPRDKTGFLKILVKTPFSRSNEVTVELK